MSESLSAEVRASVDWLLRDGQALSTVADAARLEFAYSFADGTGDGQVRKLWHAEQSVAAGADDDLVLSNLAATIFGGATVRMFAAVKALLAINLATVAGSDLLVGGAGSTAFAGPWNGSGTAKLVLPAGAPLLLVHPAAGWPVTPSTADVLRVANATGAAIAYRIVLLGV